MDGLSRLNAEVKRLHFGCPARDLIGRRFVFEEIEGGKEVCLSVITAVHIKEKGMLTLHAGGAWIKAKPLASLAVNPIQNNDVERTRRWLVTVFLADHQPEDKPMWGYVEFV